MKSSVIIRQRSSGNILPVLNHVDVQTSSDHLGWHGLRLEVGKNIGCDMDDVTVDGHYLVSNLGPNPLRFETRRNEKWIPGIQAPYTFWINPEGRPFSIRHQEPNQWAAVQIDGQFLDATLGRHYELRPETCARDQVLAQLLQTLLASLYDPSIRDLRVDETIIKAFVQTLAVRHGHPAADLPARGGIAPHHLRSMLSWLEEHLAKSFTIDDLAARAGLSVAHFSREFKRSVGTTPWGYVMQLRMVRACELLESGTPIGLVATQCGFADHSHLTRIFKQRIGTTPKDYQRSKVVEIAMNDGQVSSNCHVDQPKME